MDLHVYFTKFATSTRCSVISQIKVHIFRDTDNSYRVLVVSRHTSTLYVMQI